MTAARIDQSAIRNFLAGRTEVFLPTVATAIGRNFDAMTSYDRRLLGTAMSLAGWTRNKKNDLWSAPRNWPLGRLRSPPALADPTGVSHAG